MLGNSEYDWNTMPNPRLRAGNPLRSRPPRVMVPRSKGNRPATMRSKVVLPLPDGPSRDTTSPWRSCIDTPLSTGLSP
ncbi:hypothetical protein G6F60_014795 [Rhizopus arrhizus]|nr:hypothetical protein G6F60_014795 [Rhizopus arrhizus]